MSDNAAAGGLFSSLGRLLGTVLEMAQVRLELLGTEVELEKRRLFDSVLLAIIALQLLGVGLLLLCALVVLLVSDPYRLVAVGAMTLLFLAAGLALLQSARQRLQSPDGIFKASVTELERDRTGLQRGEQHETR
ncbi:MAG: phage holin family protein [Rhodoferax sp.]